MAIQVSVIGSGAEHEENAEQVGRLLAERGATVVTGGLGEVMAAAARGAKAAGGTTIGILPGETRLDGNPWLDHVVVTGGCRARAGLAGGGHAAGAVAPRGGRVGFDPRGLGCRVALAEAARFLAVAADLHRAPGAGAV